MEKKVYEVVLDGFNGSTDETAHLIKWVIAYNKKDVEDFYEDHQSVFETDINLKASGIDHDLTVCECDSTHKQNDTVCKACWATGRRHWNDPE
jgi:hypothetical protein